MNLAVKWNYNFIRSKPVENVTYLNTALCKDRLVTVSLDSVVAHQLAGRRITKDV